MNNRRKVNSEKYASGWQKPSSLLDLLQNNALHETNRRAFTYLGEQENEVRHITAGELDRQARAIGSALQAMNASGERALLVYGAGLDFVAAFFGCIYGGVIAIPMSPPNPARLGRTLPRFQEIAKDAQPSLLLTTRQISEKFAPILANSPNLKSLSCVATDEIPLDLAEEWKSTKPTGDSLAYLQYTSGSTSVPKGVMVSHDNVLYDAECLEADWAHTSDSVIVNWLPHFHDFGLLYGNIQPIFSSVQGIVMSPISFLRKPMSWLQALSDYKGTHCAAPNFAYDLCVRKTSSEQRATLELSSWKVAGNGGEPIRQETLSRFTEAFQSSGFRMETFCPGWGLAEGTLRVTGTRYRDKPVYATVLTSDFKQRKVTECSPADEGVQTIVGSGSPILGTQIAIVDPETRLRCAANQVGEIWVSGVCVTKGYWNRKEETREIFEAHLADSGDGPFLRTGDLGFLRDNVIFIAGRYKDLIIIRGVNYYPQDIELAAERSHAACRPGCGAAFSIELGGEERLVMVQEVDDKDSEAGEIINHIVRAIAENQDLKASAVVLIKSGSITKTSSGKIQRSLCRDDFLARTLESIAEWSAP